MHQKIKSKETKEESPIKKWEILQYNNKNK